MTLQYQAAVLHAAQTPLAIERMTSKSPWVAPHADSWPQMAVSTSDGTPYLASMSDSAEVSPRLRAPIRTRSSLTAAFT